MFQFHREDDGSMTCRITGEAVQAMEEIASVLEINDSWPIFPLALEHLYNICQVHANTDEELRDVVMLSGKGEKRGVHLFDIEGMKIQAKKLELKGLGENK